MYIIVIACVILIAAIAALAWLWYTYPSYLVTWWNRKIKAECDKQDAISLNGIPSYQNAWDASNKTVTELHQLIYIHHDDILAEVTETLKHYSGVSFNSNLPFNSHQWLKNEDGWNPIWVRFMNNWAGSAERLPVLKQIVSLFPDVTALHVSVFYPGTALVEHCGPFRSTQRYHYGLKIPADDVGLKIAGYNVKWQEHEGFVWDDTLPHSAWNHTTEPRIVIFADIRRDLSLINAAGSDLLYAMLQRNKQVDHIKEALSHEGIVID